MNSKVVWAIAAAAAVGSMAMLPRQAKSVVPVVGTPKPGGFVVAAGRVEPFGEEVKLGSELDGKLERVLVEEGASVRTGQVVAVLRNSDFAARVATARATLDEREAYAERLRNGARDEEKLEAEALLREAEAQLATARSERERRRSLLDRGAVSRSEYDFADRDVNTAQARVDAARQRLAVVRTQTRVEDLKRAEAEVAHAKAALAEAQASLDKTYIRSPLNGIVLRKYKKTGESVTAGETHVLSVGDFRALRVRVDVDERDVAKLRLGQLAWVRADAFGDRKFTGRVVEIGQALGRKNVRTDEPTERVDTKILETLVELDAGQTLPVGLRVDAWLEVSK
jgi:HlyD family secretion protein